MPKEMKKDLRSRTWTLVVYPDSAPENWRDILDDTHIAWVESPLHDKDENPDGTSKKAHWHVILMYGSKKAYSQVLEVAELLHAPIPQKVQNTKGTIRYLVHIDNPEKYQYDKAKIVCHGGAEIEQYFQLSSASRLQVLKEMLQFIKDSEIENLMDFISYCIEEGEDEWLDIVANHNTLVISRAIDAVYQKNHPKTPQIDRRADKVAKVKEMAEKGASQRVIADTLGVSERTVRRYLKE